MSHIHADGRTCDDDHTQERESQRQGNWLLGIAAVVLVLGIVFWNDIKPQPAPDAEPDFSCKFEAGSC